MERLLESECLDVSTGLHRKSLGEYASLLRLKEEDDQGLVRLGEKDLREAECAHKATGAWRSDCWLPITYDSGLVSLVAVLYISNLLKSPDEFQACSSACLDNLSPDDLHRFAALGQSINTIDFPDDATPAISILSQSWDKLSPTSKTFTEMVDKIIRSSYFVSPPSRTEGFGCASALAYIRERIRELVSTGQTVEQLVAVERDIVHCYENKAVVLDGAAWDVYFKMAEELPEANWGDLTSAQAMQLVSAMKSSELLSSLVTKRPPNSVFLSHLFALFDCVTHARLWLLKCYLPVYYNFADIKYTNLVDVNDAKVLESPSGFLERVPSYIERRQRWDAIRAHNEMLRLDRLGSHAVVVTMPDPACSRIKLPVLVMVPEDGDITDLRHELVQGLQHVLWYEPAEKLSYLLSVDVLAFRNENFQAGFEQELRKYASTEAFLQVRAAWSEKTLRRRLASF